MNSQGHGFIARELDASLDDEFLSALERAESEYGVDNIIHDLESHHVNTATLTNELDYDALLDMAEYMENRRAQSGVTHNDHDILPALVNDVSVDFTQDGQEYIDDFDLRLHIYGTEPVYTSLRRADQLSVDVVLDQIMLIYDSNKEFFLNGYLEVEFIHIQLPHGSGRITRELGETNEEFIQKKACYLKYLNPRVLYPDDEYCTLL